jgi:hypothetical protein
MDRDSVLTRSVSEGEPPAIPSLCGYERSVTGLPLLTLRVSTELAINSFSSYAKASEKTTCCPRRTFRRPLLGSNIGF